MDSNNQLETCLFKTKSYKLTSNIEQVYYRIERDHKFLAHVNERPQ